MRRRNRWELAAIAALLTMGGAVGAGAALAADGADGADPDTSAEGGESGDGSRAVLRPRWIEPQRAKASDAAEPSSSGESEADAEPDTASTDEAAAEGDGEARDWRRDGQILVHALGDNETLSARVEDLLGKLGATDVGRRVVDVTAATDQVRFFHAEDAALAAGLADELESLFDRVRVRDLTGYRPQPSLGTLEVWLR